MNMIKVENEGVRRKKKNGSEIKTKDFECRETVQYWVDNSSYGMTKGNENRISAKEVVKQRYAESYKFLDEFFKSLPKLPSHYCRRDTSKLYLEYTFQNMNQLYEVYVNNFCKDRNITPLGRNVFSKTFKEKNLALYSPKKDQCNVCFSFKYGNVTENEYRHHILRKDAARMEKQKDKEKAEKDEIITLTMDLQAVKLCPYLPANKIYFKTKLCCHNFTIFDLKTRNVMCYWFSENENRLLKASTFTTCIIDYLEENCITPMKKPIVLYSDGCGYQNRNNVLANALLNFAMKHETFIFQKYLEPGHTQMECDSVHSVIERRLKHKEIHLPSDYVTISKEARKTSTPYKTKMLEYSFFKDYSASKFLRYTSLRPGRKTSDPVINDIKCIRYNPQGTIDIKLDYGQDLFNELPCRPKCMPPIMNYPQLLQGPSKIALDKWNHLQELKLVLPKDTHAFYDNILHE
ncbi:uncharacterized protein LOC116158984 [Photinus pyralis]|uniref:uncharacterized protein LOC116158984 n=1 Tax=Photinus pyralis TaxID=7054 RepID=UPI0012675C7B|nr:uncharacterized protein LOC116158984 [Photinus pyralis]